MSPAAAPRDARPEPDSYLVGRWFATARRQGLLAAVPPEAWHTLSALLSFTCRDGRRLFTADQLALSLALPRAEALRRLVALESVPWQGQPLAVLERDEEGEIAGAELAPADLLLRVQPPPAPAVLLPPTPAIPLPAPSVSSAPAASPAVPLPTAVASVAEVPGGEVPAAEGAASADLTAALLALGLTAEQAERLLADFPAERVRRQLAWLPRRGARNPAAFLVRAVEGDWTGPKEEA